MNEFNLDEMFDRLLSDISQIRDLLAEGKPVIADRQLGDLRQRVVYTYQALDAAERLRNAPPTLGD